MANVLKEFRCHKNGYLLCKASGIGQVEIMNPSNRQINYTGPSREAHYIGLTGQDFGQYAMDMRCAQCTRLLGRALGTTLLCEIKCSHCKHMNLFDIEKLQWGKLYNASEMQKKKLEEQILVAVNAK